MDFEEARHHKTRKTSLDKLRLLLWKNLILRKRHWFLFLCEMVIPAGLMCLIVFIRAIPDSNLKPKTVTEETIFNVTSETDLRATLCFKSLGVWFMDSCQYPNAHEMPGDRKLFYGPDTLFARNMVDIIKEEIFFEDKNVEVVSSNDEMDNLVDSYYLQSSDAYGAFYIGIFFNHEDNNTETPPLRLNYDLRLQKVWFTAYVYPFLQIQGPRNYTGSVAGFGASYTMDGFAILQTIIDRAFISLLAGTDQLDVTLSTQMYPYPPYVQDYGLSQLYGSVLPTFIVFSLVLLSPTLIKSIVYEKETGVRELIRMMGLEGWLIWLGWFLYSFTTVLFSCIIITCMLKVEVSSMDGTGEVLSPILVYSDASVVFVFLLIYGISALAFCFAVSCFFSKPTLATTIGVLLWLLSYFLMRSLIDQKYADLSLGPKLVSCALPNMAMTLFFRVMSMFEGRAVGIQWNNLWDTGNPRDQLTPGMIMLMLIVDIIFYAFITWYVDKIMPGTYGVPQRWNFLFKKSYWVSKTSNKPRHQIPETMPESGVDSSTTEDEPTGLEPGIRIRGLRKEFQSLKKTKVAVEEVNLTCYKGQCTVLLGHNGAGKTTTMSILTGVYAPTSGYAEVSGWNITTNLKEAREQVGLCPQHNTLFTDLSVEQHLLFFARLKGLTKGDAKREAKVFLKRLELEDKQDMYGDQLSGGMKRKLCLAIALIGGSQVIILDEPSSGLDPESRRWAWDVIQQERGSRTVLVTTHHMEEADVLGDRVAIMANGRVVCCGSTLFLKNSFGDGYTLSINGREDTDITVLEKTIRRQIDEVTLNSANGYYYDFKLPPKPEAFATLLQELSENKETLKIDHIGLSLTTMDQVFLRVGELEEQRKGTIGNTLIVPASSQALDNASYTVTEESVKIGALQNSDCEASELVGVDKPITGYYRENKLKGFSLWLQRFKSLCMKKFIYSKRKWVLLFTQALIPVLVTILCLMVDATFNEQDYKEPSRELNITMFDYSYSLVQVEGDVGDLTMSYIDLFYDPYMVNSTTNVTETLLDASYDDINVYRENYVTSAIFRELGKTIETTVLYQSIPYHATGISVGMLDNAVLHSIVNDTASITTNNAPLPVNKAWQLDDDQTTYSSILYSMVMPLALAFLTSSFLVFPLQERVSNTKQIQLMTGTPSRLLWFTTYIWDVLLYAVTTLLIFICFMLLDSKDYFTVSGGPGALLSLLALYGIGSIPMAYVFSFLFSSGASGFAVLALTNIIAGMIISTATLFLYLAKSENVNHIADIIGNVTSLIPSYPASKGFMSIVDMSNLNRFCDVIDPSVRDDLCDNLNLFVKNSTYLKCCDKYCNDYPEGCFEKLSYFQWDYPGLGMHLMYLSVDFFFYWLLLMFLEVRLWELASVHFWEWIGKVNTDKTKKNSRPEVDSDVAREEEVSKRLISDASDNESAIVVHDLRKIFQKTRLTAVDGISFHVKKGECFGLLGVNGAGKTTTFRMLTGDEIRTSGEARIGENVLSKSRKQFMEEIGYCPQFDAIIGELTGVEMLSLMSGLRGVHSSLHPQLLNRLIQLVDLTECAKRPTSTYSGGNKRKLSTAMALVGQPPLVFLDEPTSGVDPASRRRVWEAVRDATRCGQSVILTSHSMDECEALCSKIVIMSKGVLRCVGTARHLKAKFGVGYTVQIKLKSSLPQGLWPTSNQTDAENLYINLIARLKTVVLSQLPGSQVTDEHRGMLVFRVPSTISWFELFSLMESLKRGTESKESELNSHTEDKLARDYPFAVLIEDYAAMDPTLEQVFLSFARETDNKSSSITRGSKKY